MAEFGFDGQLSVDYSDTCTFRSTAGTPLERLRNDTAKKAANPAT